MIVLNDKIQYFSRYKSNCFNCKYFDNEELVYLAFPVEIPLQISMGDNLHTEPLPEQDNDIVFEPMEEGEEI